jgi:hypothetical protein
MPTARAVLFSTRPRMSVTMALVSRLASESPLADPVCRALSSSSIWALRATISRIYRATRA